MRSVQLPTGSATKTSGRVDSVSLPTASLRESKRQQKQPPAISSTGKPLLRRIDESTKPLLWSFVMRPADSPRSAR